MVVKFKAEGLKNSEEVVRQGTRQVIALLTDLRPLWRTMGARISRHIHERWESPQEQPRLKDSTMDARQRRSGHYKKPRAFINRAEPRRQFWWTGRSMERATGNRAFKVTKAALNYNFGPQDEPRSLLSFMHHGEPGIRDARPIYDTGTVGSLVATTAQEYLELAVSGATFRIVNEGAS